MATSISSIGVGSGLPLDTLLEQLRTAENAPLAALQSRATKEQQRFSAYGTLKSALDTVSTAAAALGKGETYNAVKTSVTGDSFTATAKAGSGAIAGNYAISVERLATAQVLTSKGVAKSDESLLGTNATGTVEITFTLGKGKDEKTHTLTLDAADASLEGIAKAINSKSDLGASATLMNDGDETEPYRLMISADETGTANRLTSITVAGSEGLNIADLGKVLTYTDTEPGQGTIVLTPEELNADGMKDIVWASNAKVTINGIPVESQGNTLEDAIEGVTINLAKRSAEGASPDALRITRDDSVASTAVNNFVNAYNALQSTIKSLTAYDVGSQSSAALTGDSLARRAQSQVRDSINGLAVNGMTLSSLGIKTDSTTGNLSVDTAKLNEALKNNRVDVEQLFAGETGLSKRVSSAVEQFTKSDGLIKTSQDGITRTLKLLEGQYENMESRIDQKMETYRQQFVQLDTMMAQMGSVSSYLSTQLSMLENLGNSKSK